MLSSVWPNCARVAAWPGVDAGDRHPVQLAEPVCLEDFKVHDGAEPAIEMPDGAKLPLAWKRHSPASELKPEDVGKARCLVGLVRFDEGRWAVQPLCVELGGKGGEKFTGSGIEDALGRKKNVTLDILRERASRLLRVKS